MSWDELFEHLQRCRDAAKAPLTAKDLMHSAALYLQLCSGESVPLGNAPFVDHEINVTRYYGELRIAPQYDNAVDLVVVQSPYRRFRKIIVDSNN